MMTINIDKSVRLELTSEKHAESLFVAINNNREHLSEFLPWVANMQTVNDFHNYIKNCESLYQQGKEVSFVIISDEMAVGRIGLHHIDVNNKHAAIGYWLAENATGKGIITRSCEVLLEYGFHELGLQRIEIKVATGNLKSQAIPAKLNFIKEGILRQLELVDSKFLDIIVFSMLKDEWLKKTAGN